MNTAARRSIAFATLLGLLAGAGCNRSKQAPPESSAAPTPQGVQPVITAHAPDAFYDPPSDVPRQLGVLLRSEPLKDDTAGGHARLAHSLYDLRGRQHARDCGRDRVCANESSRRPTSYHSVGARHDWPAAEMHAVAFVGADRRDPRARPDRDSWLGRGRNRLLVRRERWPASVFDRRRGSARGGSIRFVPRGRCPS